jgi:acyl carrier protein
MDDLIAEVKNMIFGVLALDQRPGYEGIFLDEIDEDAPLFIEGLGLDSLDALELSLAVEARFGVLVGETSEQAGKAFASVRALAEYIDRERDVS